MTYQLLQHTPGNVQLRQEGHQFEPLFDYLIEYFHTAVNHSVYYGDTAQFPTHQDWLKHVKDCFYELEPEGVFRLSRHSRGMLLVYYLVGLRWQTNSIMFITMTVHNFTMG